MSGKMSKTAMQLCGIVEIMITIGIFMWARADPYMSLPEPLYYAVIGVAALLAIDGVINVLESLSAGGKNALDIAKSITGQDSGLDKIEKAKELLDAGAIDAAEFDKIKKGSLAVFCNEGEAMTGLKKRHGFLAAYLIFMMVYLTLGAGVHLFTGSFVARGTSEILAGLRPVFGLTNVLMALCVFALWRWKKWGFWGFVIIGIGAGILNTYLTRSLIPFFMVAISILIMYGILHIGGERKGWRQLE